ncbi:sodium:solute symporter family protein [Evansella clarkii]|uniref:sodium:solute symporter family protein n=1 Tax=Evansella clarkii TaxID=79879 RepID=UPI000B45304F|nr:sodium:solute symporter family protein [Evansella clarkii]
MSAYLIAVIGYLLFMVLLGAYFAKRSVQNSEDFMVAGRRLPLFVVIGTLLATFVGSGTVVGGASFIYQYGPYAAIFNLSGGAVGIIVLYFIASKVRAGENFTVPEMIEKRFGGTARVVASLFILLAYVGITAYQFTGGAYVLNITMGVPVETGTIIIGILVIFLAASGGLFSVAYTDSVSSLLIVFGFLIGLPFVLSAVGGFSGLGAGLPEHTGTWNGGLSIPQLIGYFLPLFLLLLGDQNMYQRFSAAKDQNTAKKSTIGFFFGNIAVIAMTILFAASAIVLFPNIEPDTAILSMAISGVPMPIGVLILSAAVAFLITTGTSYLLSASGNLVHDLYQRYSARKVPENKLLGFNRLVVVGLGVLAYVLGTFFPTVLQIQMYSYTMYGAAITPAVLATVLWKRATTAGILSSMIVGGAATILWEIVLNRPMEWNSVLFSLPLSVSTLIIVSLLTYNKYTSTPDFRAQA